MHDGRRRLPGGRGPLRDELVRADTYHPTIPVDEPRLTLAICSRDRADQLERCLAAIDPRALRRARVEVVLIDNGSTDGTLDRMTDFLDRAGVPGRILCRRRPGLGAARNAALAVARGRTICFSDDDCYLDPGFLERAAGALERHRADFGGGRILLHDPREARYTVQETSMPMRFPPRKRIRVGLIQGACFLIGRAVIDRIGAFDEDLGAGSIFRCEDVDYVARASIAGFTGALMPELVVRHHHGRREGPELERLKRANDLGRGSLYAKALLLGGRDYATLWVWSILHDRDLRKHLRELRGALAYLGHRLRQRRDERSGLRVPIPPVEPGEIVR